MIIFNRSMMQRNDGILETSDIRDTDREWLSDSNLSMLDDISSNFSSIESSLSTADETSPAIEFMSYSRSSNFISSSMIDKKYHV